MDKTPYCKLHFSREFKEILEQGYKVYITHPVNVDYMTYGCKPYSIKKDNVFGKNLVEADN